jgi:uncharacterized protein with PQ loop repeat
LSPERAGQVFQKLGDRFNAGYVQMISSPRARDIQQLSFSVIDIMKIAIFAHLLNSLLKWQYFIIASHDRYRTEL